MFLKLANPLDQCNLKFASSGEYKFEGYASVFNSVDAVRDTVISGAFSSSEGKKIPMFVNHDHSAMPVGSYMVKEDGRGLYAYGDINKDHASGPSVYTALMRGDVTGLSIGYKVNPNGFERKADGGRILKDLDLKEISVVNFPCEDSARIIAVKSDLETIDNLKDCENYLRDACGFSRSMATAFVSHVKSCAVRDAQPADDEIIKSVLQTINQLKGRF